RLVSLPRESAQGAGARVQRVPRGAPRMDRHVVSYVRDLLPRVHSVAPMSPVVRAAQRRLRRTLSKARDAVVGRAVEPTIETIARFDHRWPAFSSALGFVTTEACAGDSVECGVCTGTSRALLSCA